jgi:hypothetical protein
MSFKTELIVVVLLTLLTGAFAVYQSHVHELNLLTEQGRNPDGTYDCDRLIQNNPDMLGVCYMQEAMQTGSPSHCIQGIKKSLPSMPDCVIVAAEKSKDAAICDLFTDKTFAGYIEFSTNQNPDDYYNSGPRDMDYGRCLRSAGLK